MIWQYRLWFDKIEYDLTIKSMIWQNRLWFDNIDYDLTIKIMIWQYIPWFDNIEYGLTIKTMIWHYTYHIPRWIDTCLLSIDISSNTFLGFFTTILPSGIKQEKFENTEAVNRSNLIKLRPHHLTSLFSLSQSQGWGQPILIKLKQNES
jgi:hypothetical protein